MKRMLYVAVAAAALTAVAACERGEPATTEVGQSEPVNAAQDAMAGPVGQVSAATLGANTLQGYVSNAAEGDIYEIMAAEIALQKTQNAEVRQLAEMIRNDHRQAAEQMRTAVAGVPDAQMPTLLDERREGMLDNLRAADAAAFDGVYLGQQVAAHQEAVTLHSGYAENGDNAALKAHAAQVLPKIRMHLERAQQLQGSVGGDQAAQGGGSATN